MPAKKYTRLASDYDTRWSFYNEATVRHTLARLETGRNMSVLDVGCGTGNLLKTIAETRPAINLSGIEPTEAMLDIARRKLGAEVSLKQGVAENIPHENNSFDMIISNSMFHYIQTPGLFLEEAIRILKPGGQIIITDWCYDFITSKINNLMLRLGNDRYARIYRISELSDMLLQHDFSQVKAERYKINWFWGLMTVEARNIK